MDANLGLHNHRCCSLKDCAGNNGEVIEEMTIYGLRFNAIWRKEKYLHIPTSNNQQITKAIINNYMENLTVMAS